MNQKYKDVLLGLLMGVAMMGVTAFHFQRGENPVLSIPLSQSLNLVLIIGVVFGILKHRNSIPREVGFSYWKAFGLAMLLSLIASVCLGLFYAFLYEKNPDLVPLVVDAMKSHIEEMFKEKPAMLEMYRGVIGEMVTPAFIGFSGAFSVMMGAVLPSLIISLFFRRRAVVNESL